MGNTLTELVYDGQFRSHHEPMQQVFADREFATVDGRTMPERARNGYAMLRHAAARVGKASDLVRDPRRLLALYTWSCTHAPDLLPLISGHYNLTVGALLDHGEGRPEVAGYLAELDGADSVGVMLINEFTCGSNVAFLETTARYDHDGRCFRLDTPNPGARKFMPNVGAPEPRVTLVVARLIVDGRARGIFPFVLRLRDAAGNTAPGVRVVPMPDKPFFPMDNAVTSFRQTTVGSEDWLSGGLARIDDDGTFHWAAGKGPLDASRLTTAPFTFGRIALSSAAVAAARASVLILARYLQTRQIRAFRSHTRSALEFSNLQRSLIGALAQTYACTFLANSFSRSLIADGDLTRPELQVSGILAKSVLITTCHRVIQECRERIGAHGMFSVNRIPDYLGLCQALLTAEGDVQVLSLTAGRYLATASADRPVAVRAPAVTTIDDPEACLDLLRVREEHYRARTAAGLRRPLGDGTVFDRWNTCIPDAMRLADACAARMAGELFLEAARSAAEPTSRSALLGLLRIYLLGEIDRHAAFYAASEHVTAAGFARLEEVYAAGCRELTTALPLLVDAFAIDETILDAPVTSVDRVRALEQRGPSEPC